MSESNGKPPHSSHPGWHKWTCPLPGQRLSSSVITMHCQVKSPLLSLSWIGFKKICDYKVLAIINQLQRFVIWLRLDLLFTLKLNAHYIIQMSTLTSRFLLGWKLPCAYRKQHSYGRLFKVKSSNTIVIFLSDFAFDDLWYASLTGMHKIRQFSTAKRLN